jgi:hypothetical protein
MGANRIGQRTAYKKISQEHLYLGQPWTAIDCLLARNTSVPLYRQLKHEFPEVEAVNSMYAHGLTARHPKSAIAACRGLTNMTINHSVAVVRAQRDAEHSREIAREVTKIDKNLPQLVGWMIDGIRAETTAAALTHTSPARRSPAHTPPTHKQQKRRA